VIRWKREVMAGLAGTVVVDLVGFVRTGRWSIPMMLAAKLEIPLAGAVWSRITRTASSWRASSPGSDHRCWARPKLRGLTYMFIQQVVGIWLFLNPTLAWASWG
jgi:hypothetical protein